MLSLTASSAQLIKVRLHTPILHAIDSELKDKICTLNLHMQLEVQIVEFETFRCGEPGEEALGHGVDVCRQCADLEQLFAKGIRSSIALACDKLVLDHQRLTRPKVASIVE